jgi:hypothetical protein
MIITSRTRPSPPFWHWPGHRRLLYAGRLAVIPLICWVAVFVSADRLTALHPYRVRIHLEAERHLPFVPQAVLAYQSIHLLFLMAPFVLWSRRDLRSLSHTVVTVTLVAGVGFLALPAEPAFLPAPCPEPWAVVVSRTRELALPHNMVPSLHVTLCVTCVAVYSSRAGSVGKVLLWGWAVIIALSTVLLHQHHLLDVGTGWALGLGRPWTGGGGTASRAGQSVDSPLRAPQ